MFSFTMSLGGHPADPLKLERYLKKTKKVLFTPPKEGAGEAMGRLENEVGLGGCGG